MTREHSSAAEQPTDTWQVEGATPSAPIKKQIKWADITIWVCFAMMLLVKFTTIFLFTAIHQETKADIEAVAVAFEANPVFRIGQQLGMIGYIITVILLPASAIAYYYYMRRKVLRGKVDIDTLLFFVQFAFFSLVINIVNDGAALVGKL